MRAASISVCVAAGLLLLCGWGLTLTSAGGGFGQLGRGVNVVFFLGATALLLAGIVLTVTWVRRGGGIGRR